MSVGPPSPLEPGYRIDRYELLYALAAGGMGTVWVARLQGRHGFEKYFAIKTILSEHARDDRFRAMMMDEARIASRIEHPNVAQILDLGEQDGMLFLVMEYVDGDSLHKLLRSGERPKGSFPAHVLLRIVADACLGLHAAHELTDREERRLDVVHRDVSPQNILVGRNGVTKLIDFGVAKARDRVRGETHSGSLKGKLRYMAPEQANGLPVDRRADLWATGVLLYYALTGKYPYDGDDVSVLRALVERRKVWPIDDSVPRPVATLVARALAIEPEDRFASALEMSRAIEDAAAESGLSCTAADVARFCELTVGDRAEARRAQLGVALRVVEERARMRDLLQQPMSNDRSAPTPSNDAVGDRAEANAGRTGPPSLLPPTIAERPRGPLDSLKSLATLDAPIRPPPAKARWARTAMAGGVVAAAVVAMYAGLKGPHAGYAAPVKVAAPVPPPERVIEGELPPSPGAAAPTSSEATAEAPSLAPSSSTEPSTATLTNRRRPGKGARQPPPPQTRPREDDLGSALDSRH